MAAVFPRWLCALFCAVLCIAFQRVQAQVEINEFLARNTLGLQDEDKKSSDWIELYNAGDAAINLGGYYLTDDLGALRKWQFPSTNIAAKAHMVVFASGRNRRVAGRPLHTNFELGSGSGSLALVKPGGFEIASAIQDYPEQHQDISYGRGSLASPASFRFFSPPSPNNANSGGAAAVAPEVVFNLGEGVYTNSVTVALSSSIPGAVIRYTMAPQEPNSLSTIYSAPLRFTNNTVMRVKVFAEGYVASPTVTRTFWIADADVAGFSSNLPIMIASSFGTSIGEGARVPVSFRVLQTNQTGRIGLRDPSADYSGRATMKVRGSSSTQFPKKSYSLETVDAKGDDSAVSLLGLPEDSDWVLYAPYTDKTLMRDFLAYELSNKIGRYAPRTRYVELYVDRNGRLAKEDYVGVYLLVERLTKNPARINIDEMLYSETNGVAITGGYILKNDRLDPGDSGFSTTMAALCFVDPKEREIPAAQTWIKNWMIEYERALSGANYRDPVKGYQAYIDSGSFIDHHLLVEIAKNIDGYRLSTYMHKPRNGKLVMGPIWDYNLTFGNANYAEGYRTNGWYHTQVSGTSYPWYRRIFQDPDFSQAYADRWAELRRTKLRTDDILARIDQIAAGLEEAQKRNYERWKILGTYVWPNQYIGKTYADEVNWMKEWIRGRWLWMDRQFLLSPKFTRESGEVLPGTTVGLAAGITNAIYYTLDGSDPRLSGGGISTNAIRWTQPIAVSNTVQIFARSRATNFWSAPTTLQFRVASIDPSWLSYYFTQSEIENPDLSGAQADADGDGGSNLQEYLAGTNPRDASDVFGLSSEVTSTGQLLLTIKAKAGKRYRIEQSGDLQFSNTVTLFEQLAGTYQIIRTPAPAGKGPTFFRAALIP